MYLSMFPAGPICWVALLSGLLLEEEVAVLDTARKDVGPVGVEQALYLAQTASAVETHVTSILELLPRPAGGWV